MTGVHAPKRSYIHLFIHLHTLHMVRQYVVRCGFQIALYLIRRILNCVVHRISRDDLYSAPCLLVVHPGQVT